MRNVFYINRASTTGLVWDILSAGDLIVAYTPEIAEQLQTMARAKGVACFQDLMEADPLCNADEARNESVEIITREEHRKEPVQ